MRFGSLEIVDGRFVTIAAAEDWSRVERGLPVGGPFDDVAARIVNRAVGNAEDAPVLECAMVGPRVRFHDDQFVAWFDGELRVERVRAGEERDFGRVTQGLRGYLAAGAASVAPAPRRRVDRHVIAAIAGPHDVGLRELECVVTPKLDRVGIRLTPLSPIGIDVPADLPSCGMLCGTMQLHPDGSVVVMGPDHPVTGGYLQPMTVISGERWKLAQLAPGERVRFVAQLPY
jgi:allophanate hydrolase subunit 2